MVQQQLAVALGKVAVRLGKSAVDARQSRIHASEAGRLVGVSSAEQAISEIDLEEAKKLDEYLQSPDFEEVVLQVVIAQQAGGGLFDPSAEELRSVAREQLSLGIRHSTGLREGKLFSITEALFYDVERESHSLAANPANARVGSALHLANAARVAAAGARNSRLLMNVANLHGFHNFERDLRRQIVAVNGEMKLPHAGTSKTVSISSLYVEPVLSPVILGHTVRRRFQKAAQRLLPSEAIDEYARVVVLGDPGAGKSTLAVKLACDMASRDTATGGRTPILLVLREISADLGKGGRSVVEYLEDRCADPYNIAAPSGAIEYMLLNGRAAVIFDGLDELTDTALRSRVVSLIDGFAYRYPLTPVLVTSRRIGYEAAPLDTSQFETLHLDEFDSERVQEYARKWFSLDDSLSRPEKSRLTSAFLEDSRLVSDLRSNALILSMLCGMYATERYIPRNRPDVYEKCALMLFERWDRMRGVEGHSPFSSQIRSAVQHIAWELFTKQQHGGALPRRKIIKELAGNYYGKHYVDENDAVDEAERFLDFCTGRAWVLTDVGSTETEPRYGFAHRTFLEFFAAEHLVRSRSSSPSRIFNSIRRHLLRQEWEVVAQLSVQLVDRNSINGADKFLGLVLKASKTTSSAVEKESLQRFIARSLNYVSPSSNFIGMLIQHLIEVEFQIDDSVRCPTRFDIDLGEYSNGTSLPALLHSPSPENERSIKREIDRAMRTALEDSTTADSAERLLGYLYCQQFTPGGSRTRMFEILSDLYRDYRAELQRYCETRPIATAYRLIARDSNLNDTGLLREALNKFGMLALYLMPAVAGGGLYVCLADLVSAEHAENLWPREALDLVETFVQSLEGGPWFTFPVERVGPILALDSPLDTADQQRARVELLLALPSLELIIYSARNKVDIADEPAGVLRRMMDKRQGVRSGCKDPELPHWIYADNHPTSRYIRSWLEGKVSTVHPEKVL